MLLDQFKKVSDDFSSETSKLVNQFSLAGIAVVWIFKTDKPNLPLIPHELLTPLMCFVVSLLCGLLQNFIASLIWSGFYMYHENKNNGNTNVEEKASYWLPVPGWIFYVIKVSTLIGGFICLSLFLLHKINIQSPEKSETPKPTTARYINTTKNLNSIYLNSSLNSISFRMVS